MKILLAIFLLSIVPAFAQDAVLVELTPDEHTEALKLWKAKQDAESAWDKFQQRIAEKYHANQDAWVYGFEFNKDFRFMVPKPYMKTQPQNCWGVYAQPALKWTPQ